MVKKRVFVLGECKLWHLDDVQVSEREYSKVGQMPSYHSKVLYSV